VPGRQVIEPVEEFLDRDRPETVFTGLLIEALKNNRAARSDGLTTVTSLFSYLSIEVPRRAQQTPALGTLRGSEGGDIIISRRAADILLAPISTAPPPFIGHYSLDFPQSGHTTRARYADLEREGFNAGVESNCPSSQSRGDSGQS
jgi:hypothetical protein